MRRNFPLLVVAAWSLLVLSACAPGNRLVVPGALTRPPLSGPPPAGPSRAPTAIAVADFAYTPPTVEPKVIGRDFDQARQVVWEGNPGTTMADLVAGALAEQGITVSRLKAGSPVPGNVAGVVTGVVRRFEVDVRRRNMLSVYIEATVGMSLSVTGSGTSTSWETSVSSNAVLQDVYPLPDDFRKALSSAANSAAEEGVRRLQEGGAAGFAR